MSATVSHIVIRSVSARFFRRKLALVFLGCISYRNHPELFDIVGILQSIASTIRLNSAAYSQ